MIMEFTDAKCRNVFTFCINVIASYFSIVSLLLSREPSLSKATPCLQSNLQQAHSLLKKSYTVNIYDTFDYFKMYWLLTFIMIHEMQAMYVHMNGVDIHLSLYIMSLDLDRNSKFHLY